MKAIFLVNQIIEPNFFGANKKVIMNLPLSTKLIPFLNIPLIFSLCDDFPWSFIKLGL